MQAVLNWFISASPWYLLVIPLTLIPVSYMRAKVNLERTLLQEGSLQIIRVIMLIDKIDNAWGNQNFSNSEVWEQIHAIGDQLQNRGRQKFLANVCGENIALFVSGPRIILKVPQDRTRRSLEYALHFVMTPRMCKDLGFYPKIEFVR